MVEQIIKFFEDSLRPELIIFIISMLPVLELRGGLIAAAVLNVDWLIAFPICVLGNMLPIPLELLFIRKIFSWLKRFKPFYNAINWIETRATRKGKKIEKYKMFGLFTLVAIPLPGTGAWTGGLVSDILDIRIKHSIPIITAGVVTAGLITSFFSYIVPKLF